MRFPKQILPIAFFMLLLAGCHHSADLSIEPSQPAQDPDLLCSADTVYFQNTVFPIINAGCATTGCHDAATHKGGHTLDNYNDIVKMVHPFDPQASKLYTILFSNSEGSRMPPKTPFTSDEKSVIYWWIKQGAHNNNCANVACDSTIVTYTTKIKPIVDKWCIGCHAENSPTSGISLGNYDQMVACVNSGRLMGSLRHEPDFSPMPKSGQLSVCSVNLFQIWINNNTPQ